MNDLADNIKTAILCNQPETAIREIDDLLSRGFNVDQPLPANPKGFQNDWTLLFWACLANTDQVLKHLVERHHASLEVRDSNGYTPLHLAAFHCKVSAVRYLIERGASIDATSSYGESLEELVLRKPLNNNNNNSSEYELREYIQKLLQ